ncbi:MAG TPA: hypothetical protein VGK32_02680 [Vicinamibacterales bacterium]
MRSCPKCGSPRVHRSRSKGFLERFRKTFTSDRVHRCHACGWRGWGTVTSESTQPKDDLGKRRPAPDLVAIDEAVDKALDKEVIGSK